MKVLERPKRSVDTRVKISEQMRLQIKGQNEAKISIAQSDALRREKKREALR